MARTSKPTANSDPAPREGAVIYARVSSKPRERVMW